MIKVWRKRPGEKGEFALIENTLSSYQSEVGGYIEIVPLGRKFVLIVNEEGKLQELDENFDFRWDVLVGTVLGAQTDGEDFTDIESEEDFLLTLEAERGMA